MSYEFLTTNEAARLLGVSRPLVIQWIDSGKLKGFRLPGSASRRVPREAVVAFARENGIPLAAQAAPARRILVVDDDAAFAEALRAALTAAPAPWDVQVAASGFEAGRFVASAAPQVILLDIRLKDVDGRRICRTLREDPRLRDIRIVAMSGYLTAAEEKRLRQQGFDDFLRKPFPTEKLLARLDVLVPPNAKVQWTE